MTKVNDSCPSEDDVIVECAGELVYKSGQC